MTTEKFELPTLHPYQEYAKNFILNTPGCGLFLDCGLGKTLITLMALYDLNPNCHVLVIAPKNIARSTWLDEIKKWHLPLRTQSLLVNEKGKPLTKKARLKKYEEIFTALPSIYFINRELLCDLIKNMPRKGKQIIWPFPIVVIDELQGFKSYTSERFKALTSVRPAISRLIGLTGTPAPNGLMDLWAEIFLMDGGQRLGKNITAYRNRYFLPGLIVNNYPVTWTPMFGAEDEIYSSINDVVISIKNTAIVLPELTYSDMAVDMDPDERKQYAKLKNDMVLSISPDDDLEVSASNAAVLAIRLSQMASGAVYVDDDDGKRNTCFIHGHKLDACEYIVNNTTSPVLIAYHFKSDLEMLKQRFPDGKAFDGSPEMVHAWNDKQIPVMFIQPASAGHGLNLQQGGHTLIWYTLTWNLEEYIQCNARLHRQGQTEPVVIHHILTRNTIDERILNALRKKDMNEQALLEAVRAYI